MKFTIFILSYLVGSIPFGILIGKLKNINIKEEGSGNIGASNIGRTLGWQYGVLVGFLDGIKGLACILIAKKIDINYAPFALSGSVLGHMFSIFTKLQGGKGVATLFASLIGIDFTAWLLFIPIWLIVIKITKHASVASAVSMIGILILEIIKVMQDKKLDTNKLNITLALCVVILISLIRHKENFVKILKNLKKHRTLQSKI